MNVGTAELRNRLSHFLREVRKGKRLVVLDRGRAVAQIVPFVEGEDDLASRIDKMTQEGVVTAKPLRRRVEVKPIALHRPHVRASRLVSQMRDER